MSEAAARPSLARVQTRASEKKRNEMLDTGLKITVDGEVFEVRVGDVTPAIAAELRKHTGMGFFKLMSTCAEDPDVDVLSAFEWLARRVRGEDVDFADVELTYEQLLGDDFDVAASAARDGGEDEDPQT
jgi:hypothetical protein